MRNLTVEIPGMHIDTVVETDKSPEEMYEAIKEIFNLKDDEECNVYELNPTEDMAIWLGTVLNECKEVVGYTDFNDASGRGLRVNMEGGEVFKITVYRE